MPAVSHLLLAMEGGYSSAGLSAEIWATTLRLALVFGSVDDIGTLPSNWAPAENLVNRTETLWDIEGNWKIAGPGTASFNADDYLNDQVAPAITTFMSASYISNAVRLDTLKIYPIASPTGRSIPAPPFTQGTPMTLTWTSDNPVGGTSAAMLPPQDSLVLSNRSGQTGRRGRGRNYWPALTVSAMASGRANSSTTAQMLAAQIALLEALAYTAGSGLATVRPIITGKPFVNYGTITQVQVGDVFDTQQRRRDRLIETRTSGAVSY